MGTTLTGTQIQNTYDGLLKTTDNTAINATPKLLTDGLGNDTKIAVGTAGTDFTGNVDFSGATVTGLPAGAAGLESGTGTDSMQSAASLTTTPANAAGNQSISLGNGASSVQANAISIGNGATAEYGIAIGTSVTTFAGGQSVSIGHFSDATANETTALGYAAQATGTRSTAIGSSATANASGAVAIGRSVTGSIADTVSIKALETQTNSTPTAGGIIMSDAGGTDRRINIDATGIPQIDSDPMLVNDSTTNVDMTKVWSGTEAQYTALGTYDANTLYFLT